MSTYSTRFIGGRVAAPNTLIYTATAAGVYVVRDITVTSSGTGAASFFIYSSVSGIGPTVIYQVPTLAIQTTSHWEGRVVLEQNETIVAACTAGQIDVFVSGYLLSP